MGRPLAVTLPDGAVQSWSYVATNATFTDESRTFQWVRSTDAFGRLTDVIEPGNLSTHYNYDAFGNLSGATQSGNSSSGDVPRTRRSFVYDSLSRLASSSNIETGAASYLYDAHSNLQTKTDALGIRTNYLYDELNRLISKTYTNDPSGAPASCYRYDGSGGTNLIGRLAAEWTQNLAGGATCPTTPAGAFTSRVISGYDAMGRVVSEAQCVNTSCSTNYPGSTTYTYDLAGNLKNYGNLIGTALFTNSYDGAGRLLSLTNVSAGTQQIAPLYPSTLFSSPSYTAAGGLSAATYGTGLTVNRSYDSRLRIAGEIDTGGVGQGIAQPGTAVLSILGGVQSK